jgi:hypothetical protein
LRVLARQYKLCRAARQRVAQLLIRLADGDDDVTISPRKR